jgi:hypothetical protein
MTQTRYSANALFDCSVEGPRSARGRGQAKRLDRLASGEIESERRHNALYCRSIRLNYRAHRAAAFLIRLRCAIRLWTP